MQGPPIRPASDSAVMAKSGAKDPQSTGPLQGQFPTPAESVGKSVPVKKPPPTGKPKSCSSSLSLKAAYASMSSTAAVGKGDNQPAGSVSTAAPPGKGGSPPTTSSPTGSATTTAGAQSSSSKEAPKTLEEKGKEMMKKKQEEKDPGMSYTTTVLESLRSQENPQTSLRAGSWEEQRKEQQKENLNKISTAISQTAVGIAPLPSLLMGRLLNAQPYESPVEGWVEGMYHPVRKPGGIIVLPFPEAAGGFQWTSLGESDLQGQPKRTAVPLPNPDSRGFGNRCLDLFLGKDMGCSDTLERGNS